MESNVKELSTSENEIEITLKFEEIKKDIDEEVKKQSRSIQLPGFRKGKVPMTVIRKRFGDSLVYEASEKVANQHFWNIAKEKSLNPIGQPTMTDFNFKPGEDLRFKVKYEIVPKIEVREYSNQKIEIPDFTVKDSDVEKELDHIIRSNRTFEETNVVGDDKKYLLDVHIFRLNEKGEEENEKGEKIEIDLTNEGVHKEILERSAGKNVGDSFNFRFDDERKIKNDKEVEENIKEHFEYKVVINGIKKIILPELTEEFVKKVTKDKVSNEEDLRKEIRKDIEHYYEHRTEEFLRGKLITSIINNNDFTPPQTLVNNILGELVKNEEEYIKKQGYPKISPEELRERYKTTAENDVKWFLLKTEIIKKENLTISDEELKTLVEKDAEKTGISSEKLMNYYKNSGQNEKLLDKKLFDFLKEKNDIVKVDPEKLNKNETKEA